VSVQFGRWNLDGRPADREYLAKAEGILVPYGPDGGGTYIKDSVGILFRAFHTTKESRCEAQPHIMPSGTVLTWDGRLDNRAELIGDLRRVLTTASTDVSIVAAAYERWGTACFAKLIGDWALSIWNPMDQSLILVNDPIGTRHLYYSLDKDQVSWSTILDPLVLLAGKTFALEGEYIAGWLSFFPATHLTPYVGIHSVPPSASVCIQAGKHTVSKYWDFDPGKIIRYDKDGEYEEHFRSVFGESVRRRLRSDDPILAELSGGMDSSSIVCMADTIIARGVAETPRLDTISYYDDSEPNWNERPYFAKVEEKRGCTGCHIRVDSQETFKFEFGGHYFAATPGSVGPPETGRPLAARLASPQSRVVLSGVGGDEVMGGVPTPTPELADLLARAQFVMLANALKVWALKRRQPWFHLFMETARSFFPLAIAGAPKHMRPAAWLERDFVRQHRDALTGYQTRLKLFGPLPSLQENLSTLEMLRRQLGCAVLSSDPPCEKRFPYLDRDLLEFLYAIPRQQLVRPGQRRSLMRRALAGTVPPEILHRARKAFVARGPLTVIAHNMPRMLQMTRDMVSAALGVLNVETLRDAMRNACEGKEVSVVAMIRTFALERWLLGLRSSSLLELSPGPTGSQIRSSPRNRRPLGTETSSVPSDSHQLAKRTLKRHIVLTLAILGGVTAVFAGSGKATNQAQQAADPPAYHDHPPTKPLPPTLDPDQFKSDPTAFVAYWMAARLKEVLYQEPCYCPCNNAIGHKSLLDCFATTHAALCAKCKSEAVFCYLESGRGQSVEQIRSALPEGKAWKLDLAKYANEFLRTQAKEKEHANSANCRIKRRAEKIQPEKVECP